MTGVIRKSVALTSIAFVAVLIACIAPAVANASVSVDTSKFTIFADSSFQEQDAIHCSDEDCWMVFPVSNYSSESDAISAWQEHNKSVHGGSANYSESRLVPTNGVATEYKITVTGAKSVSYSISGSGRYYASVSSSGVVTAGSYGLTGSFNVTVVADGKTYTVPGEVKDMSAEYADELIDNYIKANITGKSLTEEEQLRKICEFACTKPYSTKYQSYVQAALVGGDCWASSDLIEEMCDRIGLNSWTRNANMDAGAGSGHVNVIVEGESDNVWYKVDAGFVGTSLPRSYSVNQIDTLFDYTTLSDGTISVYQYSGDHDSSDGTETLEIPSEIDGNAVSAISDDFYVGSGEFAEIVLPDTVTSIGENAFRDMGLEHFHIGSNVTSIGSGAFANNPSLTDFTSSSSSYPVVDGVLYNSSRTTLMCCPAAQISTIPSSVTKIDASAFEGNSSEMVGLLIPSTVKSVGEKAFYKSGLVSAIIESGGITELTSKSFATYDLVAIRVPSSVTTIASDAIVESTTNRYRTLYVDSGSEAETYGNSNSLINVVVGFKRASSYQLEKHHAILGIGESLTLEYTASPSDATVVPIWTRSDSTKVSLSYTGKVKGVSSGEVTITCTDPFDSSNTDSCTITVVNKNSSNIVVSPSSITMTPGESDTLDHYWRYESTYGVSWSSSDTSVAKVDANGKITAVAPGEAVVTLKSKNSSINMKATCKVTVTGTGSGQVTRIAGATRYETALKLAEYEGYDSWRDSNGKFSAVVIACGSNYPDALGGSYLAVKSKAPIILTDSSRVDEAIDFLKDNLASGGTVYILGGTGALPSSLESGISNLGIGASPVRLGGKTRYDTSMMILEEAGVSDGQDILIATGKNYADSLSASSSGRPIMLVGDSLTQEQKTFLSNHPSSHVYLLGGSASVSKTVESQVKACCGGVSPSRLAGKSRYETSVAIAEEFFPSATQAVVSYARNFPDGLAAGPLANNIGAPVILTDSSNSSVASSYANSGSIGSGIVTGGASIIPDGAVYKIFNVKSITRI